jgi:HK97 family phage major capsid protein
VNATGGFLVPPEFENDLIDLREQYGVFRQFARITPMARDTKSRAPPDRGLTAYFTGEAASITESDEGVGPGEPGRQEDRGPGEVQLRAG